MIYRVFQPTPMLTNIVDHYWYAKVKLIGSLHQYYPTPLLQGLTFNFKKQKEYHSFQNITDCLEKQFYLFGQPICPRTIIRHEKEMHMIGVKFKPLGIAKVTGINMEYIAGQNIPADDIWACELESLSDAIQSSDTPEGARILLEEFLVRKYAKTSLHYRIDTLDHAISLLTKTKGTINIKTLQEKSCMTRKTLERAFLNYVGVKPKLYARIIRMNAAKEIIDNNHQAKSLTEIAHTLGFYDSSHFAQDFKKFSGLTATEYISRKDTEQHLKSFCPFFQ